MIGLDDGRHRWIVVRTYDGRAIVNTDNIHLIRERSMDYDSRLPEIKIDMGDDSFVAYGNFDEIIDYLQNGGIL